MLSGPLPLRQPAFLRRAAEAGATPSNLLAFILRESGWAQLWLAALAVLVFATGVLPLEVQRRIVNGAVAGRDVSNILLLAGLYAGAAALLGLLKLAMNVYRGYVGERCVRRLRAAIMNDLRCAGARGHVHETTGVEISMVLDEAEPIGSFVGVSLSEPLLQGGILVSVFAYMTYLNPLMALLALAVFSPQLVFVPLMQRAINRRVATRIRILRQVSVTIVAEPESGAPRGSPQGERLHDVFLLNMGVFKLKFSMNFLMNMMHHLGIASVLALGGYYVVTGQTQIGTVVAFLSGLAQINDPWGDLVNWFRELSVTRTKYDLISRAVFGLRAGN